MLDSVPRPPASRSRRAPRLPVSVRTVALGALLTVLAVGCGVALRLRPASVAASKSESEPAVVAAPARRAPASTRPTTTVSGVRPFTASVGDAGGCQTLAAVTPQLLCPIPTGTVTYTQVTDLAARYRAIADPGDDGGAERGEAACARGRDDERAWSRPETPARVAGRYRCRIVSARAEMWWTIEDAGVLAHATRTDADLAALFSWWRARTEW